MKKTVIFALVMFFGFGSILIAQVDKKELKQQINTTRDAFKDAAMLELEVTQLTIDALDVSKMISKAKKRKHKNLLVSEFHDITNDIDRYALEIIKRRDTYEKEYHRCTVLFATTELLGFSEFLKKHINLIEKHNRFMKKCEIDKQSLCATRIKLKVNLGALENPGFRL